MILSMFSIIKCIAELQHNKKLKKINYQLEKSRLSISDNEQKTFTKLYISLLLSLNIYTEDIISFLY